MQCKNCEYPLWNLKARQCPECGTPFRPSEFEFVKNSVRYDCPDCGQSYYGRGEHGHLVPRTFECVNCHRPLEMDEMLLRPAADLDERQTRPDRMPWLERRERGFIKAWFATVVKALVQPGPMMRGVPVTSSLGTAWWFAVLSQLVIMFGAIIPSLCVMALLPVIFSARSTGGGPPIGAMFGVMAGFSGVTMFLVLIFTFLFIGLWGLVSHGVLLATGGSAEGIGRTYQALCYSSGANAVTVVPCLGGYVGWIWWVVSAVMAVKEAQRVHGGRAAFAVLTLPIVSIVVSAGLYALLIGSLMVGANAARVGAAIMAPQAETASLSAMVSSYAATRAGARVGTGPAHLVELMPENQSGPGIFVSSSGSTASPSVPLGDSTLGEFQRLGVNLQRIEAAEAARALPDDVIAHRLGDFVYTGHGIDFGGGDDGLWILVLSLDPDVNPSLGTGPYYSARLDGTVRRIMGDEMAAALDAQNALRAENELAPLPEPESVTHARPAVALPSSP